MLGQHAQQLNADALLLPGVVDHANSASSGCKPRTAPWRRCAPRFLLFRPRGRYGPVDEDAVELIGQLTQRGKAVPARSF
jgi:hypothetical protein